MKLPKKQEAEILKVYNAYRDGYLKGDVVHGRVARSKVRAGEQRGDGSFLKKKDVNFLYYQL